MKVWKGNTFEKIFKMKFGRRMYFTYLIGGLLPMLLISVYLVHGTNKILVEQAENTEMVELEGIKRQILEIQNTMTTMSQYFYFDEKLEEISGKQYDDYQEMIEDYREYTAFLDYRKYYNNLIARISVYMRNKTLKGNMNFVVVDEQIEQQEWYQKVGSEGNSVVWAYLPNTTYYGYDHALALTRMIKTKSGEAVGVLAIYLRPERFEDMLLEREGTAFILLNGETVISHKGTDTEYDKIAGFISGQKEDEYQERIKIDGREYVITVINVRQKNTKDCMQVVSVRAVQDIIGDARKYNVRSILICCLSVILACVIIAHACELFSKRLEHFYKQMQKASDGKFDLEPMPYKNDEFTELYDYLCDMIQSIQRLLADIYREQLHAEQLKTQQKDAEFKMLTSQINPHFLYNTLETIRMKAVINQQQDIAELVSMLAKILRSAIRAGENSVSIQEEMELAECYLKIQNYRFGDKIRYHIELNEELAQYRMLSLVLQPIVENAIIHGLEKKEKEGYIEIDASRDEDDIIFTIEDDGIGISEEKLKEIRQELQSNRLRGEHIGIFNVQYRIRLKYGERYGVSIDSKVEKGTRVEIKIPACKKEEK